VLAPLRGAHFVGCQALHAPPRRGVIEKSGLSPLFSFLIFSTGI